MAINTTKRSEAVELMDDFAMKGEILTDALDKIAAINRLLGGNKITLEGIQFLLRNRNASEVIDIQDIGCGNGDMLRMLAKFGRQSGLNFKLTGIDANQCTIDHAVSLSVGFPEISYECRDVFHTEVKRCDIVLLTLTLHHFADQQIISLLSDLKGETRMGIIVNDLERSALAYRLFTALSFVFNLNDMSREDGLVSILRGFKRADLIKYSKQLGLKTAYLKWRWAFRYLWIIKTS